MNRPIFTIANAKLYADITKAKLTEKGYQIISAKPVGIGFHCKDWILMPEREEKYDNPVIVDNHPIFLFKDFNGTDDWQEAAVKLFIQFEAVIATHLTNKLNSFNRHIETSIAYTPQVMEKFVPNKDLVTKIALATGADTICLNKFSRIKYTTKRALGSAFLYQATYNPQHMIMPSNGSSYAFISGISGEVLWQNGYAIDADPQEPLHEIPVNRALRYFPDSDMPLDKNHCTKDPNRLGFIFCE